MMITVIEDMFDEIGCNTVFWLINTQLFSFRKLILGQNIYSGMKELK